MTSESDTAPLDESPKAAPTQFAARFPPELLAAVDTRAKSVELSRNAWMEKALTWVLANLPTGLGHPERDEVATKAPREVAGTKRLLPGAPVKKVKEHAPDKNGVVADLSPF